MQNRDLLGPPNAEFFAGFQQKNTLPQKEKHKPMASFLRLARRGGGLAPRPHEGRHLQEDAPADRRLRARKNERARRRSQPEAQFGFKRIGWNKKSGLVVFSTKNYIPTGV